MDPMSTEKLRRVCLALGSLCLLLAIAFGERLPDFYYGLLEGLSLALMLGFLTLTCALKKQRRGGNGGGGDRP